jgi:hypothetical protein
MLKLFCKLRNQALIIIRGCGNTIEVSRFSFNAGKPHGVIATE